ncbi:MAG: cytochrome c biogenesis protein CcsA [Candidatus Helarchaeota archaeon]|nr:cytochrome c biogenesis protein CcsA [Candidatus Helarchaeota archaeon]
MELTNTLILSLFGTSLILVVIAITVIDLFFLIVKKKNLTTLAFLNMGLTISIFMILEICFLNDYFIFDYVYSYSESALPVLYKFVAIWAGQEGSILTWMVFNSIIMAFFRIKSGKTRDIIFNRSVIIILLSSTIFLVILFLLNPFRLRLLIPSDGLGLNPLLLSPYMILHPLSVFLGYAVFIVPFAVTISELLTPKTRLEIPYQRKFFDFTLKFGWLVISLGIGIGAYWASIADPPWSRFWGWDAVETVSLIPWLLCTAYFHSMAFRKKNPNLARFTIILIFLANIFATLLTRGGGFASIHTFVGSLALISWVVITGLIATMIIVYIIYTILITVLEEYENTKTLFNYLSYLFLMMMAFIFLFGLLVPPTTYLLSTVININAILLWPSFYATGGLIFATALAIALIVCSLNDFYTLKQISIFILLGFIGGLIFSLLLLSIASVWINPLISIYLAAFIAAIFHLFKDFNLSHGMKKFFRRNAKVIIHAGISLILMGTLTEIMLGVQSFFFIVGFFILLVGIIPSILVMFFVKYQSTLQRTKIEETTSS